MTNIAIFASGNGSNAENIINYVSAHPQCGLNVALIVASRPDAGVIQRAHRLNVPVHVLTRPMVNDPQAVTPLLGQYHIDAIILAGFMLLVPQFILRMFPDRIINIHPSLLPRHGGKGMYGHHVHQAVIDAGDTETGITIHLVNEEYDRGTILFQAKIPVNPGDTPHDIEQQIHRLEYLHYPRVIAQTLTRAD